LAGLIAGKFNPENVQEMPLLFLQIGTYSIIAGLIVGFFSLLSKQWESVQIER
jgi:POT family proton-dependent oligopeptide transporter